MHIRGRQQRQVIRGAQITAHEAERRHAGRHAECAACAPVPQVQGLVTTQDIALSFDQFRDKCALAAPHTLVRLHAHTCARMETPNIIPGSSRAAPQHATVWGSP